MPGAWISAVWLQVPALNALIAILDEEEKEVLSWVSFSWVFWKFITTLECCLVAKRGGARGNLLPSWRPPAWWLTFASFPFQKHVDPIGWFQMPKCDRLLRGTSDSEVAAHLDNFWIIFENCSIQLWINWVVHGDEQVNKRMTIFPFKWRASAQQVGGWAPTS